MKTTTCKELRCPRYCAEAERAGTVVRDVCRTQDTADTLADWLEPCHAVTDRRCAALRREFRRRRQFRRW